ncbi:PREDICTED: perforin-1-like [Nanorana parkeri]|uniref:perforin-1-like n=1 Tax=Nanorana parkeri TaxID=125878 RepID=UPI000854DE2E|nr:PREDICTED: perforin-1-like [Nanorana parkeri]
MKQTKAHLVDIQRFSTKDNTCTVCHNPYMNKAWQKLPLAMAEWRTQSYCSRKISSEVSRSSTSLAEEAASEVKNDWEAGLELHHKGVDAKLVMAGSQSQMAQFGQSKTSTDRYTFIRHQLSCAYYRVYNPHNCLNMWLILILVSFATSTSCQTYPPLTNACRPAKKPECDKVHAVPGHNLIGQGFDIVTMKQTKAHLVDIQRFSTKDNTCTVCHNPYMNKAWQKLPLAMAEWRTQSYCSRKISSEVSRSSTSLAEEAASEVKNDWEAGLELHHKGVDAKLVMAGSQSQMAQFGQSKTSTDRYTFIRHQLSCAYYSFRLTHLPLLSKDLRQALKSLPPTYDAKTHALYRNIISIYGTHYINQADVGGQVVEVNAIKACQISMDGMSVDELKDCLNIEASVAVTGKAEASAKASACKEQSQKSNKGESFHQTFNEKSWEVRGGKITFEQLSFDVKSGGDAASFQTWMDSLKINPDIVTYSLEPIHNLVRFKGPRRENLRNAISEYIMEKALRKNCSCPGGSLLSPGKECNCICPGGQGKNINCCPSKRGLAKVVVTVKKASGLWGDHTTRTDAFVKISVGLVSAQTQTIWNDDNPNWNMRLDLGLLELSSVTSLKVEVWDEDNKYDDDLLGTCQKSINSGQKDEVCYLNHGSVSFTVSTQCVPHLTGPLCRDYAPSTS